MTFAQVRKKQRSDTDAEGKPALGDAADAAIVVAAHAAPGAAAPSMLSSLALLDMDSLQGHAGYMAQCASEINTYVEKALV